MRRICSDRHDRAPAFWASFCARLGFLFTALALFSQSLVLAAPMGGERLAGARAAQAQLSTLLGPGVVICAQGDNPDSPSVDCQDSCPLCRLAADASGLDAPTSPVLGVIAFSLAAELEGPVAPPPLPSDPALHPLPRGPPSQA